MTFSELFAEWHGGVDVPKGVREQRRFESRVERHEIPAFARAMRRHLSSGRTMEFMDFLMVWKDANGIEEPALDLKRNPTSVRRGTRPHSDEEPAPTPRSSEDQIRGSNPRRESEAADTRPSGFQGTGPEPKQNQDQTHQHLPASETIPTQHRPTTPAPGSAKADRLPPDRSLPHQGQPLTESEPYPKARWAFDQIRGEYDGKLTSYAAGWAAFLQIAPDLDTAEQIFRDTVRHMAVADEKRSVFGPRLDTYLLERMYEQGRAYGRRYDGSGGSSEYPLPSHHDLLQD